MMKKLMLPSNEQTLTYVKINSKFDLAKLSLKSSH